jgi:DNA-binding response OmpR family regulator
LPITHGGTPGAVLLDENNWNMKKRILIVEDEKFVSTILRNRLVRYGFDAVCADNVGDGIRETLAKLPDLMILDWNLIQKDALDGIRDGFGFLEWLKQNLPQANFPIIIYTSESLESVTRKGLPKNVCQVIKKQKDLAVLFLAVRKVLEERIAA